MSDDRRESPHYIPELDPDNPASGPKDKQHLLVWLLCCGMLCVVVGGALYATGLQKVGLVVMGIGVVALAPLIF